jgi:single-strand DNA-binding protein
MRGINFVQIGGNLGKDPEVKYINDGTTVASFNVAVNEKFKKRDGDMSERTDWFKVVCFSKTAETVGKYVTKGMFVIVWGQLRKREWEKDGEKKFSIEIVANRVDFGFGPRKEEERKGGVEGEGFGGSGPDDDVPF